MRYVSWLSLLTIMPCLDLGIRNSYWERDWIGVFHSYRNWDLPSLAGLIAWSMWFSAMNHNMSMDFTENWVNALKTKKWHSEIVYWAARKARTSYTESRKKQMSRDWIEHRNKRVFLCLALFGSSFFTSQSMHNSISCSAESAFEIQIRGRYSYSLARHLWNKTRYFLLFS